MAILMGGDDTDGPTDTAKQAWLKVLGVIAGLVAAVSLMVLAFLAPAINSGPHDLPVSVSGPAPVVEQLTKGLTAKQPGAFDFRIVADQQAVAEAVHDRKSLGGIAVGPDGAVTITVAGGAGAPYFQLFTKMAEALRAPQLHPDGTFTPGKNVTLVDVAPLTKDDPQGVGLNSLGLPLAFGGMISAVLLSTLLKHRPLHKVVGSILASIAVGFVVVAILQFGFGSLSGNYALNALALGFGTAAISLFVLGMEARFGFAGLGIGGLAMMFIANPLSGMATGWQWLPSPWGAIGQLMPIGAAGSLLRSTSFFDGHGATKPIIVLLCWVVVGILMAIIVSAKKRLVAKADEAAAA